ncbi:MAG: hypothetical protein OXG25_10000 [Gammaproteobacteria bacterium]|nr:hypothetical protein [Gammaproteobacteria bacterium]
MPAEIIPIPGSPLRSSLGSVIRVGNQAHRRLQDLRAEGRLPGEALIVDASVLSSQESFIGALRDSGAEVILDTKIAELSEAGTYKGKVRKTPWAIESRPLKNQDFTLGSHSKLIRDIAQTAVKLGVSGVLSPSRFLRSGLNDPKFLSDIEATTYLREALDREGGNSIAIDYSLILPRAVISERRDVEEKLRPLRDLPIDNLFCRLAEFGYDAGPLVVARTFHGIARIHDLGLPIVLDCVGGFVGLAAMAFGVVGGISQGIGEYQRFSTRHWADETQSSNASSSFGRPTRIPIPGLATSLKPDEFQKIAAIHAGRRLIACGDRDCCPQGLASMLKNHRAHIAKQQALEIEKLANVPDARRAMHFVNTTMQDAERKARDLAKLKTGDDTLDRKLARSNQHTERMSRAYEILAGELKLAVRSPIRVKTSMNRIKSNGT